MKIQIGSTVRLGVAVAFLMLAPGAARDAAAATGAGRSASFGLDTVSVMVRSTAGSSVDALERQGAELVAERQGYRVYRVDRAMAAGLSRQHDVRLRADFDRIQLRRGVLDTLSGTAPSAVLPTPTNRRLKLVQLVAPPSDKDIKELTSAGARIVQYVPQNAYLVWTPKDESGATAAAFAAASSIRFYSDYLPDYALSPRLDAHLNESGVVVVTVQVFNHGPATKRDIDAVIAAADRVLSGPVEVLEGRFVNLRVEVPGKALASLASIEAVVNVEPYFEPQLFGERQGRIMAGALDGSLQSPTGPGHISWLASAGFSTDPSDYPVVAVVDDGVDNGTTAPANSEFYEQNNAANPARITFSVLPPGSSGSGPEGPDGHGNINASIVGGFNADSGAAAEDGSGFNYGLGISPYGRLANVRVFSPSFDAGAGDSSMVQDYYGRGAGISTNSWGASGAAGDYTSDSQLYDALTRDAQSAVAGNQELLFVFSAGNDGPSATTLGSPGTSKNVLTVGASETSNPDAASGDGCGLFGGSGDDARDMASFSSRGPCTDGRTKPDIVAPGTFIQGAASQPNFNGGGVCGAVTNDFAAPGADALFPVGSVYTWSSGTSHSTPAVAGYASLIQEFVGRVYGVSDPSPALQKAYVIHSGRHLTGTGANEDLPGGNQGFGMADMGIGFDTDSTRFLHDQATVLGSSGESATFVGSVLDPGEPVRVALVWTDAPGAPFASAWVNDLDLTVQVGGNTYLGNNFTLGISQTGGSADSLNNAEAVFLPVGQSGVMTITVDATTIAGDGVPGNPDFTDQDFALVAYNFVQTLSAGIISLDQNSYNCSDTVSLTVLDTDIAGAGSISVSVAASGGDSESVSLVESPSGSGTFSGTIATAIGAPASDGVLQVADAGTLTATYNDADDGTGNPASPQANASIDCTAPSTTTVSVSNIGSTSADVTIDTDETTTATVRFGTSCAALAQSQTAGGAATTHLVGLAGLNPLTTYFFAVDLVDGTGNATTDDNSGSCYSFSTLDASDYFTELFSSGDNDVDNQTLTLVPDGSGDYYVACRSSASSFPTDPAGGTVLALGDDDFFEVTPAGGQQVFLYGVGYTSFFVGSNGYITFDFGSSNLSESLSNHFAAPRVSGLYDDLDPSSGGTISWRQLPDRIAVTFDAVPQFGTADSNSFQIELFLDGTIRMTHLGIDAADGLIGLSEGLGEPIDFMESDLTGYGSSCVVATPTATDTVSASPTPTPTPMGASCPTVADQTCQTGFSKGFLLFKANRPGKEKLVAKMLKGPALTQGDMGNPLTPGGTEYGICIYDESGLLAGEMIVDRAGELCSGKPCWKAVGKDPPDGKGYKFNDKGLASDGVQKIIYKGGGSGKSKAILKGKGPNLPAGVTAALQSSSSATVQLRASDGECLSVTVNDIKKQESDFFKGKGSGPLPPPVDTPTPLSTAISSFTPTETPTPTTTSTSSPTATDTPSVTTCFHVDTTADGSDTNPGDGVCDDGSGNCTLRAAVEETNALPGANEIVVPAGVYTASPCSTGGVFLTISDDLTVTGAGTDATIIDGGGTCAVVDIDGFLVEADLSNITIRNGFRDAVDGFGRGVGLHIGNSESVNLSDCVIRDNLGIGSGTGVTLGAGVFVDFYGTLTMTRCLIANNEATGAGGIYVVDLASALIAESTIRGNRAVGNANDTFVCGGGLFVEDSTATVIDSTFEGNTADYTGGSGNDGCGGAIFVGTFTEPASISIERSLVVGNSAPQAAAINNQNSTVVVTNTTITENFSTGAGFGVSAVNTRADGNDATTTFNNATIVNNVDNDARAALYNASVNSSDAAVTNLKNTVIVDNLQECDQSGPNVTFQSWDYNVGPGSGCGVNAAHDQRVGGFPEGSLDFFGGPTRIHSVPPGSAAHNRIPASHCTRVDGTSIGTDQRGAERGTAGAPEGACDVGAFEITDCGDGLSGGPEQCDGGPNCSLLCAREECVLPPAGMIAWWTGDGVTDEIVGGRNGSLVGDATYGSGRVGQAFDFDGSGDYVSIPDDPAWTPSDQLTIDLWVKMSSFNSPPNPSAVIGHDEGTGEVNKWAFEIGANGTALRFAVNGPSPFPVGGYVVDVPYTFSTGLWYHLAVTGDQNTRLFHLYVNGQRIGSGTIPRDLPDAAAPLRIGFTEPTTYTNGLIDEVEIFDRVLTQPEIDALYRAEAFGKCTGCGDGFVDSPEECDDGGNTDGDGCSQSCTVEPGYSCFGEPSVCDLACGAPSETCGNALREFSEQCDGNDALACPGMCLNDCSCDQERLVFVTSGRYSTTSFGGAPAYDQECQMLAANAGLPGGWFAWVSSVHRDARSLLTGQGPFRRVDGVVVANDRTDLLDSSVQNPISTNENGNEVQFECPYGSGNFRTCSNPAPCDDNNGYVMTGTNADGAGGPSADFHYCWSGGSGWDAATDYTQGWMCQTNSGWTDGVHARSCTDLDALARLYCFQR